MTRERLRTPVAFLIFNRPETTERVFGAIRKARPLRLLVVADGPRPGVPGEAERCAACRRIAESVDWPCEILTNYSNVNLGLKRRISSGINWIFESVDEAIVLEDDCLPDPTFFGYCDELLDRYRDNTSVGLISGDNFQSGRARTSYSYYFSRYVHIWGWATWKRTWKRYDPEMALWPEVRDGGWLRDIVKSHLAAGYWRRIFEKTHRGEINTWDYQLQFAVWLHGMLSVLPNVNLVSNIGYGSGGTNTMVRDVFADIPTDPVSFPLAHPPRLLRDAGADRTTENLMFSGRLSPWKKVKTVLREAARPR